MSGLPALVDLAAYRGDTWTQVFRFSAGGSPLVLTGATVASSARDGAGAVHALVATVTDAANGEVTLGLPPGSLPPGAYAYDVEVTNAGAVATWVSGQLSIRRDVTNELP